MDWFLYDKDLRHERVKSFCFIEQRQPKNLVPSPLVGKNNGPETQRKSEYDRTPSPF